MCNDVLKKVILAALVVAAGAVTDHALGEPNKVEKALSAKVSMAEAIMTASEKVSGTVIEAKLDQKHDELIWRVAVVTPENQVMEIQIDAHTGMLIDVGEEKVKSKRSYRRN